MRSHGGGSGGGGGDGAKREIYAALTSFVRALPDFFLLSVRARAQESCKCKLAVGQDGALPCSLPPSGPGHQRFVPGLRIFVGMLVRES